MGLGRIWSSLLEAINGTNSNDAPRAPPASAAGASSADAPASPSYETAVMDTLMRTYEKEMQTPIQGILVGNLMTAMLIQLQKLKVHTEAAMLTMDQVTPHPYLAPYLVPI